MEFIFEALVLGLVLSADSFSAALALGLRPHQSRDTFKFALSSGGAEALVAFLGAMAGEQIVLRFDEFDHWVSFGLLSAVALHMAFEAFQGLGQDSGGDGRGMPLRFHSFAKVLAVSFATSLDAFAVGVGLGASGKPLPGYLVSIGAWAFVSTLVGMSIARRAPKRWGAVFSFIGSFVLFALAFKFLFEGL